MELWCLISLLTIAHSVVIISQRVALQRISSNWHWWRLLILRWVMPTQGCINRALLQDLLLVLRQVGQFDQLGWNLA